MTNNNEQIKNIIISLYNEDNERVIDIGNYEFTNPIINTGSDSLKNSIVYLEPKPSLGLYGRITIYYDRIPLSTFNGSEVSKGNRVISLELCDELNSKFGIGIYSDDLLPETLGALGNFTITASPSSLVFMGSGNLILV
jgi:hypothetical protein